MNMKFVSKNISINVFFLLILIVILSIPYITYANRADYTPDTLNIVCLNSCNDSLNTLTIPGITGTIRSSNVKTRAFEMRRSDNSRTLARTGSSVPIGTTLRYENKGSGYDARGAWYFSGGEYDSPDMNGQWYRLGASNRPIRVNIPRRVRQGFSNGYVGVRVNRPENQNPNRFTTTGPVSCNANGVCTVSSTQVGNASITIRFPGTTAAVRGGLDRDLGNNFDADIRTDTGEFRFRSTEYTYNFSVFNPNRAPTVSCTEPPFNISYTSAEARWAYNDVDGDAQTNANIQVATNANFTTNSIVANVNANGDGTTRTIRNLSHSTTYYTRVRVRNAVNDWTGFSTCPSFRTLVNRPARVNLTSVAPADSDLARYTTAIVNWTYTDPENDRQIRADIQFSTRPGFPSNENTITYVSNGAGTSYTQGRLLPGETYYVRFRAQNGPNGWTDWSNSRSVTLPDYPNPEVTYSISKSGDPSTARTNGQTLVLDVGNSVNANWSINNGTQVGLQSCTLSTTGGTNLAGEQAFRNSLSGTGFARNINNQQVPNIAEPVFTSNRTYNVNLSCAGRPAKRVRTVNRTINLTVNLNRAQTVTLNSVSPATTARDQDTTYTSSQINWTYTDPENDRQTRAEIQISTAQNFPNNPDITKTYVSNGTGTSYIQGGLLPGERYFVRVRAENGPNGWSRWSNTRSITMSNYPVPQVSFDLRSGTNTAFPPNNTLTIRTNNSVNANWSITDSVGVVNNSCRLITTNTSGGVATDIFGNTTNRGFSVNNLVGQNLPISLNDQTYRIELRCEGKPAKVPNIRNVSATINLTIESYPIIISCSVNRNTVQAGQANLDITAQVSNVIGYNWEAGVNNNSKSNNNATGSKSGNPNPDTLNIPLTYSGIEFGRYTPWLKVTRSGTTRFTEATCGTVANLGDSNVREVR